MKLKSHKTYCSHQDSAVFLEKNAQKFGINFQILKMLILTIFAIFFFVFAVAFMEERIFKGITMTFSLTSENKLIFILILYSVLSLNSLLFLIAIL